MTVQVRRLELSEYKQAALTLSEAFQQDLVARYFLDVPDRPHWSEAQKWDVHVAINEFLVYAHTMAGLATTVGDNYGGVALWLGPGHSMDGTWTMLKSGICRVMYKLSPDGRRRMFKEFFPLLHDTKVETLGPERDPASFYLVYLGTTKQARGKGYAKQLLLHGMALADAQQAPVYLESSNAVNVAYYRKFGFEVASTIAMQAVGVPIELDIMVREPNAASRYAYTEKQRGHFETVQAVPPLRKGLSARVVERLAVRRPSSSAMSSSSSSSSESSTPSLSLSKASSAEQQTVTIVDKTITATSAKLYAPLL